jgi:UDP-3-O-[3-hydroxymyristoyl] N-acetylglucosamine deacetylase
LIYPDEVVRHKVLDLIGDTSLVGVPFAAHIVAVRPGHRLNVRLARELAAALRVGG